MLHLWKLLTLLAVLLMPLGMAPAPAAMPHHPGMAGMALGHCPDQNEGKQKNAGIADCAMACAAALPAIDAPRADAPLIVCEPVLTGASQRLHGLHPETATPPPKRS